MAKKIRRDLKKVIPEKGNDQLNNADWKIEKSDEASQERDLILKNDL